MPRRNNRRMVRRRRPTAQYAPPVPEEDEPTTEAMAMSLVRRGLASLQILDGAVYRGRFTHHPTKGNTP